MSVSQHPDYNPWDRLRDADETFAESQKHYAAFWDYAEMGAGTGSRSLRDLAAQYEVQGERHQSDPTATPKPPTTRLRTLKTWSSDYAWVARAEAYDQHVIEARKEELARRRQAVIDAELRDYEQQLQKWRDTYTKVQYHESDVVQRRKNANGEVEVIRVIKTNAHKMHKLTQWRREISQLGRLALGMPERITSSDVNHGVQESAESLWAQMMARSADEVAPDDNSDNDLSGWE